MLKTVVLLHIYVKTVIHISGFFYKWKVPKLFILNEKKYNDTVFTVTFDEYNFWIVVFVLIL